MMFPQHEPRSRRRTAIAAGTLAAALFALAGCSGVVDEGGGASGGGDAGESFEFTLSTGAQPGTPNAAVQDWYLDRIEEETEGRITFERTAPEALCKAAEVVECVRDGRAQIGVTVPDYTPQYFPSTSMVSIPFLSQNSAAIMQSLYDIHEDYQPAMDVMEKNGLHHVATWPVGRMLLGSPTPLTNKGELSGLSMRASGPIVQKVLSGAGVNIQAITAPETYEAVQRGVINSIGGAIDFPVNYKIMELLPYWTDPGIGQYSTFGMWFSAEAYDSLPDDLKATVDKVTEELNTGEGIAAFNKQAAEQCQQMLDSPTVEDFTSWEESATDEWASSVEDETQQQWVDLAKQQGLDDAEGVLDEYLAGLDEYNDLEYDDATLDCEAQFAAR
jgi:TRAP-type C4-dicarboxylate transport system substrate-binding protein